GVPLAPALAGLAVCGWGHRVLARPPHQHAGAPVDETLDETFVQRIGELDLDRAGDPLPVLRVGEPVRTVCRKGPGPDVGDTGRERIDVAVGEVRQRYLAAEPVYRNPTLAPQKSIEGDHQLRVRGRRDLTIVGDLADLP